jgi:hypothetical protein
VICQQRSHTTPIRIRVTCRWPLKATRKSTAWCRGNRASSYRRQASGRSHQPHRRLWGDSIPYKKLNCSEEKTRGKVKESRPPNRRTGSPSCFDAFSSREPLSTSLENALVRPPTSDIHQRRYRVSASGAPSGSGYCLGLLFGYEPSQIT